MIATVDSCTEARPGAPVGTVRTAACLMPAVCESVSTMRHFTVGVARQWGMPDEVDEAVGLIVTELVANAVRHSGSRDVAVVVTVYESELTASVSDSGQWCSRPDPPDPPRESATSGRGLLLVDAYADSVTFDRSPHGTRVTARVALPSHGSGT
ncbi:ATP-binding protein [Streptomyces sp. SID5474]|nr:ATP-binding protein [Streptomyces sp. SID5474]